MLLAFFVVAGGFFFLGNVVAFMLYIEFNLKNHEVVLRGFVMNSSDSCAKCKENSAKARDLLVKERKKNAK